MDTIVLVLGLRPGGKELDFLPLQVEYQEKIYAAKHPGHYFRREIGRPSEKETLTSRLIDRPIRPLFRRAIAAKTQVITVLDDQENDADTPPVGLRRIHRTFLPADRRRGSAASTASSRSTRPSRTSSAATSTSSWPAPRPS
jgi:hypothetical protein